MSLIVINLFIYQVTGSAFFVGIFMLLRLIPAFFMGNIAGVMAVDTLAKGKSGVMTAMQKNAVITIPLEHAVQKLHLVNPKGPEVQAAMAIGTSFGI